MAKRIYQSVDGVAMRSRRIFDTGTEDGIVRAVCRAYFAGVDFLFRPCWSKGEIAYYGIVTGLPSARDSSAAAGEKLLFAGGTYYATVSAYTPEFTVLSVPNMSVSRDRMGSGSVGCYALFAGGRISDSSETNTVDAYDADLTRRSVTGLGQAKWGPLAESINGYFLLAGGAHGDAYFTSADAYDTDLTRTVPASLNTPHQYSIAVRSKTHILMGGGASSFGNAINTMEAYDAGLTRLTADAMRVSRRNTAAARAGDYGLYGGGYTNASTLARTDTVDAFGTDLTRVSAPALYGTVSGPVGAELDSFGMFLGGHNGSSGLKNAAAYDGELVKTDLTPMTLADYACTGTLGDALFLASGNGTEVYTIK